jgi:hypothetical protein
MELAAKEVEAGALSKLSLIEVAALEVIEAALSTPAPAGELREVDGWEVSYELLQGDDWCAGTYGPTALAEIQHYAAVYSQDGPVQIIEVRKRALAQPGSGEGV